MKLLVEKDFTCIEITEVVSQGTLVSIIQCGRSHAITNFYFGLVVGRFQDKAKRDFCNFCKSFAMLQLQKFWLWTKLSSHLFSVFIVQQHYLILRHTDSICTSHSEAFGKGSDCARPTQNLIEANNTKVVDGYRSLPESNTINSKENASYYFDRNGVL